MKTCISRLITFINHLWQTCCSTFVEHWLLRHVVAVDVITAKLKVGASELLLIKDDTENTYVLLVKGGNYDEESD